MSTALGRLVASLSSRPRRVLRDLYPSSSVFRAIIWFATRSACRRCSISAVSRADDSAFARAIAATSPALSFSASDKYCTLSSSQKLMIQLPRGLLLIAPRDLLTLRRFTQEESCCDILLVRFVLDLVILQISLPLTRRLQQRCVHLEVLFALGIGITLQTRPLFQRSACISPLVSTSSVIRRVVMRRRIVFILRRRPTFRAT